MLTKTIPLSIFENIDNFPAVGTVLINCLISIPESPNSPPTSENRFTNVRLSVRVGGLLEINDSWFRLRRVIGTTEEDLNNANQTGMYWHGRGLFNGNGWHGILLVFNTGTYIAKIDINFINPTWKIFIWNHEQKTWD